MRALLLVLLVGCSGTEVRRQAMSADVIARAFNSVGEPTLVAAYESACRGEIDHVCREAPCDRALMEGALAACDRHWQPAMLAYEATRALHSAWRLTLMRCQVADAGSCTIDLARDGAAFMQSATRFRCAIRALGRADLDPIPGAVTCEVRDGG